MIFGKRQMSQQDLATVKTLLPFIKDIPTINAINGIFCPNYTRVMDLKVNPATLFNFAIRRRPLNPEDEIFKMIESGKFVEKLTQIGTEMFTKYGIAKEIQKNQYGNYIMIIISLAKVAHQLLMEACQGNEGKMTSINIGSLLNIVFGGMFQNIKPSYILSGFNKELFDDFATSINSPGIPIVVDTTSQTTSQIQTKPPTQTPPTQTPLARTPLAQSPTPPVKPQSMSPQRAAIMQRVLPQQTPIQAANTQPDNPSTQESDATGTTQDMAPRRTTRRTTRVQTQSQTQSQTEDQIRKIEELKKRISESESVGTVSVDVKVNEVVIDPLSTEASAPSIMEPNLYPKLEMQQTGTVFTSRARNLNSLMDNE